MHKIVPQSRVNRVGILFGLPLLFIDSDQFLSFAGIFAKAIVGDSIKPGRKLRFTAKAPNVPVSANKRVLGEIVRQLNITAGKLAQQTAHARLMTTDQLAKSVLVVIGKNSSDEVGIG